MNTQKTNMKTPFLKLMTVLAVAAMACGTPGTSTTEGEGAGDGVAQEHHAEGDHTLRLDDGKTWEANPETIEGIGKMQGLVMEYDPATMDGVAFKQQLEAYFQEIFAKCTMTGEAHDQLHNYLQPLKDILDSLGEEPTEQQLADIKAHLNTFSDYFH